MSEKFVDRRYYEATKPRSVGERLTVAARERIYRDFIRLMRPSASDTVLDVGASDVVNDAANVLERTYPHADRITAVGLGEAKAFQASFPNVAYQQIRPNAPLPFADKSFDIATSNAVLEHVGSPESQVKFVSELTRVASRVFITVPNRLFPVEHHTGIPLLHYWRGSFALACGALGKREWLDPANLILMSRGRLTELAPQGRLAQAGHTGLRLGPFSSNLFLAIRP